MQYFICGEKIPMHKEGITGGFQSWNVRHSIPSDEIRAAYPKTETVIAFQTEQDALDYCNSITKLSYPSYIYPIYVVDCEKIEDECWQEIEISYSITEFTPLEYSSNKQTHSEKPINIKRPINIAEVPLSSLQPVSGMLKRYYDVPHARQVIGTTDFQENNSWQCSIF